MPQLSFQRIALLLIIVISVFFTQLGDARLWDRDEPRNAQASHEMLQRQDWIVPTFNGELRVHKPILLYWGQMSAYLAFGESTWTARLPSALAAVLCVLAIAKLASRLSGSRRGINRDGFWGASVLATCTLFVMAGRAATPDALLIAFSTLGIALLVSSCVTPAAPYSSGYVGSARWLPAMLGYLSLGFAALAKGPVGIILPLGVVGLFWLVCRQHEARDTTAQHESNKVSFAQWWIREVVSTLHPWRILQSIWALKVLPGVCLTLLAAAPWYVAVGLETDGDFLRGFFIDHNVGRALQPMEGHVGGWWFYPAAFLVGIFPWSLWLIPIGRWGNQAARENVVHRQLLTLASVWVAVYITAFSIASTKLPSYITPCYAGAALWIGSYLRQFESSWRMPSWGWRQLAYAVTILFGVCISAVVWYISDQQQMPNVAFAATAGLALVLTAVACLLLEWQRQPTRVPAAILVGAAAFQIILFGLGATWVDGYRQDLKILANVKQQHQVEQWLSIGGLEPSWVHYLGDHIVEVQAEDPTAWQQVNSFWASYPDGCVIAVAESAQQIEQAVYPRRIQAISTAPRFLRPGELVIYRLQSEQESGLFNAAIDENGSDIF